MDDVRIGRIARALRRRSGWRQVDLATRVGCHQTTVSRLERGQLSSLALGLVRRIFVALGASIETGIRWRGGDIERLLDQKHARVIEAVATYLRNEHWAVIPEATYSEFGERGSIDILALRARDAAAAVFEIKVDLTSVEGTIRKHGEKARLAPTLVARAHGWRPTTLARILVVADNRTARRVVDRHESTFRSAYPHSSREVRRWLAQPSGDFAGIWFLSVKPAGVGSHPAGGAKRVRVPRARGAERAIASPRPPNPEST